MGITCSNRKNVTKEINKIDGGPLNCQNIQEDTTQEEYECKFWNISKNKWERKIIQIKIAKVNDVIEVKYLLDGQIIRIEQQRDISAKLQVLTNLEQIYSLEWLGKYQENFKKMGKWTAIWKGEKIKEVGGYYAHEGQKNGIWNDIIKNYGQLAHVYEIGEYNDNQKIGQWIYVYEDEKIGGGRYNQQRKKEGKWIELSDYFWNQRQVTYNGEYKNGKKVGRWDIFYRSHDAESFQQMYYYINKQLQNNSSGGGFYEDQIEGDSIKVGRWIDIGDEFYDNSQITFSGEYKKGKKIGKWDIRFRNRNLEQDFRQYAFDDESIDDEYGGGSYDSEGYGIKIGKWIELRDGLFSSEYQGIYSGEYTNGKKVGRWDILSRSCDNIKDNRSFKQIGGGSYVDGDDEIKIGEWIEFDDEFDNIQYLLWKGEYKNGKKVGRWAYGGMSKNFEEFGGGSYHEEGGIKIGGWKELYTWPQNLRHSEQKGEYKNGKKVGRWDILYHSNKKGQISQIFGGQYHEQGDGIKIGKWIEQTENIFLLSPSIIYEGEYSNGIKVGEWDIFYIEDENKQQRIGGGSYDQQRKGFKIGNWIEINDEWNQRKQITQIGQYQNGRKVGQWMEMNIKKNESHDITNYDN